MAKGENPSRGSKESSDKSVLGKITDRLGVRSLSNGLADNVGKAMVAGKKIVVSIDKRLTEAKAANDKVIKDTFEKYYKKYPILSCVLESKYSHDSIEKISEINGFIGDLEKIMTEGKDEEAIGFVLELAPKLPELNKTNIAKLLPILANKSSINSIYKNKDFLVPYLQNTKILNFNDENFLTKLVCDFPINLIDQHKSELLDLAKKYDNILLGALLLNKIHDAEDLKFYLNNSTKISSWYKKMESGNPEVALMIGTIVKKSPSRAILERHLDDLMKITDKIIEQHGKTAKGDPHAEAQYVVKTFSILFGNLKNEQLIKEHGDLIFKVMGAVFLSDEKGIDEFIRMPFWFRLDDLVNTKCLAPQEEKIKSIFSRLEGRIDAKNIKTVISYIRGSLTNPTPIGEEPSADWSKKWSEFSPFIDYIANNEVKRPDGSITDLSRTMIELLTDFQYLFDGKHEEEKAIFAKISKLPIVMNSSLDSSYPCELRAEHFQMYKDFLEKHGDLPKKTDTKKYGEYILKLKNIQEFTLRTRSSTYFTPLGSIIIEKYAGYIGAEDFIVADYLNIKGPAKFTERVFGLSIGIRSKLVEEFLDKVKEKFNDKAALKELRKEYILRIYGEDGENIDLRVFDYKNVSKYFNLFEMIRSTVGNNAFPIATFAVDSIDISKFVEESSKKPLYEVEEMVNICTNSIDPNFGERLFKAVVLPRIERQPILGESLLKWSSKTANGESKIDVTQNNMKQIKQILRIFVQIFKMNEQEGSDKAALNRIVLTNIQKIYPSFSSTGNMKADAKWFFGKFDVEEINFKKMESFSDLVEYQQLISVFMETDTKSAITYLQNKFRDIDFDKISFENEDYSIFNIKQIEKLRLVMNANSKVLGDMVINMLGSSFLEKTCCDHEHIPELLKFAHSWENPGLDRDVNGLYQLYSKYAFVEIASFIKENLEKDKSGKSKEILKSKLEAAGMDYDDTIQELQEKGYLVLTESNVKKFFSALTDDNKAYAIRKASTKLFGDTVELNGKKITARESDWAKRDGVKVYSLSDEKREIAKLIKCDPTKIKVKVLAELSGRVNMDAEARNLGRRLVFSAPLTFSTRDRKMTELAFRDGIQMNYLLSPYTKDGFLLVNQAGEQKVLNKKNMKIQDLLSKEDLKNEDIKKTLAKWAEAHKFKVNNPEELLAMTIDPVQKLSDKNVFFELLSLKKYSLLGGMLLIDKQDGKDEIRVNQINDGGDSRRLYLQFADGQFGILDSTEKVSTNTMIELALQMGATKAMYMDTGMYDMATYQDGSGSSHIMGHEDTNESTNRVVIYEP